ncbi:MAG: GTP cyclohydrolase I FolE [Acidimicrobiaceae bacterium]|nr:GTP cyclohydrolase I FolE [Acidimicrobiaceae bacterium]
MSANSNFDRVELEATIRRLIELIGEDPDSKELAATPKRVALMYEEILSGRHIDPADILSETYEADHDEMVMVSGIRFSSMCEHHLLPFFGVAHVAYIPNLSGRIVGISKLAKLVEAMSMRLQVQERMTKEIAESIVEQLKPQGVMVVVEAEHLCMAIRGVKSPGSKVVTSSVRGRFRKDPLTRSEALQLIGRERGWGMP